MEFNVKDMLKSVGLLYSLSADKKLIFIGTCFAFGNSDCFLTAAHCIDGVDYENLQVLPYHDQILRKVSRAKVHPSADLAIVYLDGLCAAPLKVTFAPYKKCVARRGLGEEFGAFGFPEDFMGPNQGSPTPRVFRGYFQRFMEHKSVKRKYSYLAAELSIACPSGLSGGPIFRIDDPTKIIGLVSENIESSTQIYYEEKESSSDHIYYHKVIEYGVVVLLEPLFEWVNEHIVTYK